MAPRRVKRGFLRLVKNTVNRVAIPIARSGHGPLALIRHVGRRTGRTYETPLVLARIPDGFVAELTYGADVDWYRNVTAAGRCVVVKHGVEYAVDRIESCSTEDGLAAFGSLRSLVLRALRRHEFRRLHVEPAVAVTAVRAATEPATAPHGWAPPRPTAADVARQVRDVIADLPLFLTAPFLRRWHRRWGASAAEVAAAMPGDALFPHARYRATRAISIAATPEEVWPWLVQVGCLRGGWYADDLLDNLAHPSARQIVPELQSLTVGMWLPMDPRPTAATAFVVDGFHAPDWMLWRTPTSTWAWRLTALPDGRTRLLTRLRTCSDGHGPRGALTAVLMEIGDFPMMRRMLLGIRARAEAAHPAVGFTGAPGGVHRMLRSSHRRRARG